jgi:hypothetical protein
MRVEDFKRRAEECMCWARRSCSLRDRALLLELARAWCDEVETGARALRSVKVAATAHRYPCRY